MSKSRFGRINRFLSLYRQVSWFRANKQLQNSCAVPEDKINRGIRTILDSRGISFKIQSGTSRSPQNLNLILASELYES